ncbi:MAG: type VI secretion system baseplate subunit TssF [Phycisphaerales bacterium]|nr:type VI secretion system baseplate subunit TssF [Phycisphaerales bacterium]
MDRRLLRYYDRELAHLRETAAEFAREFPKVAGRLGLEQFECADPYVERLLEGFAFLTARVQLKLDAEFPRFTQGLLETVYPHYLCPTPSMCVVQFNHDKGEASLIEGVTIPRGRALRSPIGKGENTACEYRTAHPVTLFPLQITQVEYHTRGLAAVGAAAGAHISGAKAAIRIRLAATAGATINAIKCDKLVLHLTGMGGTPGRIYEQIISKGLGVSVQPIKQPVPWSEFGPALTPGSDSGSIRSVGFEDDHALLPVGPRSFQGYRLVHEYFVLPQRFMFVELTGLRKGFSRCTDTQVDVVIFLSDVDLQLENAISAANFQLHCTPTINLFPKRLDRIHVSDRFAEFHAVPDRTRPLDYEVYDIAAVEGYTEGAKPVQTFRPFYAAIDDDADQSSMARAYFALNRLPRTPSSKEELQGRRSSYAGSEVYISLVDAHSAPYRADLKQLGVEARCTNRDLPLRMPVGKTASDFRLDEGAPVESIKVLVGPTAPRASVAEGETAWRIISHLALNYLSLADTPATSPGPAALANPQAAPVAAGASALRDILKLYADTADAATRKQVDGVRTIASKPIVRRVPTPGPIAFARGLEITITLDEDAFEGVGCFTLGAVLEQFFAKYVSLNSFTETVVRTSDRGEIMRWPTRIGRRPTV